MGRNTEQNDNDIQILDILDTILHDRAYNPTVAECIIIADECGDHWQADILYQDAMDMAVDTYNAIGAD